MRKLVILFLSFFILAGFLTPLQAEEKINLYFFYGDGCPHCAKEEIFLDRLEKENANINIYRFETWGNRENAQLLSKIGRELEVNITGVPVLFVGDQYVIGYYNDKVTGQRIKDIITKYEIEGCSDIVGQIIGNDQDPNQCVHQCDHGDGECLHGCGCSADSGDSTKQLPDTVAIPFFGEINVKNLSLPIFTFLLAAADGFNPCAMWVLLFLISLLLGLENRKRMWILGAAFIIASGVMYFLFLSAWLNLFLFLGFVWWVRFAIATVAVVSGAYHLRKAWQNRDGCEVTENEKRKKVFKRLRNLAQEKKFAVALGGIILLAFAVNLVELVCSAGLPAVFTQVLSLSNLSGWHYYGYLVFYIIIFMLDDMLIFVIAMTTLKMKAISSRYTKWSGWVGGILMVIIGLLLLFKPGWLMFG